MRIDLPARPAMCVLPCSTTYERHEGGGGGERGGDGGGGETKGRDCGL